MSSISSTEFVPESLDATNWANLKPLYAKLIDRPLADAAVVEELILDRSELDASASEAHAQLYINMTCDTEDEAVKQAYIGFVEDVAPELKKTGFELDKRIAESRESQGLDRKRYEVLLRDLKADVELFREENVPLQTDDTKLAQRFSEIAGAMTVEFRGEVHTLPQMSKYFEETDRATREQAWRAVSERRYQDHEALSGLFDEMIVVRQQIAKNAGFDDYRAYMFEAKHRFDYTPAHCMAFHDAVEQTCMPVMRELDRQRKEELGVELLRPWDLGVDVKGRDPLRPFNGADELVAGTSRIFHRLDPELGGLFDSLRGGEWLDLESRRGKAPGGYQQNLDRKRRPFIFMNATGLQRDLMTMIHEAGHAFHSLLSRDEPILHYRHAPIEFCEVASIGMELLAMPYMDEFYSEAEANRARRERLEQVVRLLPWIATIDAFQHWLYTHPNHTHDERAAYWESLGKRFGAAVSWDGIEHYRSVSWQRQLHLFEVPFYYIEYGIAELGALQLWLQSLEDESRALANYKRAMRLGGSRPLPELFEAAELTFDFGPKTVNGLMDAVKNRLNELPA